MSILAQIVHAALSAGWGWYFFLSSLFDYSRNLSWYPYLVTAGWISMFFLFLKIVEQGEEGYLKFVAWDLKTLCKEGAYWPLNFFPFLQGIKFSAGFTIVLNRFSTLGSIAGNPNIRHNYDQNMSSLQIRATTDSLAKASFFHNLNRLMIWLFSFWDEEGRFRYYKLGSYLYVACWVAAFIGNFGSQASQAANQVVSSLNSAIQRTPVAKDERFSSQLRVGRAPNIPPREYFNPTKKENGRRSIRFEGDERIYFLYLESDEVIGDEITIKTSSCMLVPPGKDIYFRTKIPPTYTTDMEPAVSYYRKKYGFTAGKIFDDFLLEAKTIKLLDIRTVWHEVETERHPILMQAFEQQDIPASSGGLVCF